MLLLAALATAQRDEHPPKVEDESWSEDPYTEADPEALRAAAGYVRYAPLPWTTGYGSDRVEQALGDVKLRWVETAHFRIGSSLRTWKVPGHDREARKRLAEELARLREKLPEVPSRGIKELDPWLRLHLYAQRLEELYARFCEMVGATEASFPQRDGDRVGGKWMGRGPYLGVGSKFNVLLCHKSSTCARYLTTFTGADGTTPSRWYLATPDDLFVFATAVEYADWAYADDTALYSHVVFNVVSNLIDAYCGYVYEPTSWWQEGLAHSFRRRVSEEHNTFSAVADRSERIFTMFDWERRTYGLVKNDAARPLAELGTKFDLEDVTFYDHLGLWSRIEFLRARGEADLGRFVTRMKQCVTAQGLPTSREYVLREQAAAMQDIWGFASFEELDAAWIRWALKEYRGKK